MQNRDDNGRNNEYRVSHNFRRIQTPNARSPLPQPVAERVCAAFARNAAQHGTTLIAGPR